MIYHKLLVGISPNLKVWRCSRDKRWTNEILRSTVKRSRSQQDHVWSNNHFGRNFLTYLLNHGRIITTRITLSGRMTLMKVISSEVKAMANIFRNSFFRWRLADQQFAIAYHLGILLRYCIPGCRRSTTKY